MLTEREKSVLVVLIEYIKKNQYPPSFRDVISLTDISTTSMIHYYYGNLEKKGYIKKADNKSRAIRLKPKAWRWYKTNKAQMELITNHYKDG